MVKVEGTIEEIARLFSTQDHLPESGKKPGAKSPKSNLRKSGNRKKIMTSKRKPSKYNLFMKKELKRLKKAHPRTKQSQLMKKAARAWRKHK